VAFFHPGERASAQTGTPKKIDFTREIQPILATSCYGCHGAKSQMAGLRFDSKEAAFSRTIRPGKSAESTLYQRVAGLGDQPRMPMGGKLDPQQIEAIRGWIDQGAEWPDPAHPSSAAVGTHWAFLPPARPPLPDVANGVWPQGAIDRFILARLEKEGLSPSPAAARATLLRRVSLDLIGLPPTLEEIDAFLADQSPRAYEKQVDRLLASPHYGERWGRIWLDAARYADSDGYEKDKQRNVWFYRDWVISALNRNLRYDRFITEQIAGDLLPDAKQDQIVATGFLRNSMTNEEGGIDPEQFRMEAMFDRMDAIGKGILGVTIQCAQCHNHKYDPLTHEEYYRLFAFLNDSYEGSIPVYTPEEMMKRAEIARRTGEIEGDLQHRMPDWQERMAQWEQTTRAGQPEWIVVTPEVDDISTGGQKYLPMPDGSFLTAGYAPTKHTVKLTVKTELRNITAFRLELLNDRDLPLTGPGRSIKGTCALTEFRVEAAPASTAGEKPAAVKITAATADVNPPDAPLEPIFDDRSGKRRITGPVAYAIDDDDTTAWGIDLGPGLRNQPRKAVFTAEQPVDHEGGTILIFHLKQNHGGWNSDDNQSNNLGRFRLSITTAAGAVADPLPKHVREILSIPASDRTPDQKRAIFSYWRTTVPEWKDQNERIEALWKEYPEGTSQLVLARRERARDTHILERGDFLKPGKNVAPGVPAFLNALPSGATPTRLTLARWLVDPKAPTTARAFVNRVWQAYFGTGIVASSENLGTQCDPPSHPELLDWLAVDFMESGWDMKALHRSIVTSAAYRQSSNVTPELIAKDPYNRLVARGPRFRVDAEIVRDIALAASGLLNRQIGGPSVYPPAPPLLFVPPASYGPKIWKEETGEQRYRRALYTFRYRSVPYPMLQAFDAPNGDTACVRRPRSNTPLQALTTMNEPLFVESARALAKHAIIDGGATDASRLTYVFRRCLSRPPTPDESAEMLPFLARQRRRLRDGWLSAPDIAGLDVNASNTNAIPEGSTPAELAAWTTVSRVLLNLDETITKE
jgi:hypothetical protein